MMTDAEAKLIDALERSFVEVFDALRTEEGPWPVARAGLTSGAKAVFVLGGASPGVGVLDFPDEIRALVFQEELMRHAGLELADEVEDFLDEGPAAEFL